MINKNDILADLHSHTFYSGHGYSTIEENINVAKERGLKFLAITDHYMNDGTEWNKRNEINRIKSFDERVRAAEKDICVIGSAEFNIGQSVYTPEKLNGLKWRPVGLHKFYVQTESILFSDLYALFEKASNEFYNAFVHIERELNKVERGHFRYTENDTKRFLDDIVALAKEKHMWLEVNESSLLFYDPGAKGRMEYWLNVAKELGCKIYLGSDAHYSKEIGIFSNVIDLLNKIDYPEELILNCNLDWMNDIFKNA